MYALHAPKGAISSPSLLTLVKPAGTLVGQICEPRASERGLDVEPHKTLTVQPRPGAHVASRFLKPLVAQRANGHPGRRDDALVAVRECLPQCLIFAPVLVLR